MDSVLVSICLLSILYVAVIIIGLYQAPKETFRPTRHFRYCMWICLLGLVVELLAYKFDGRKDMVTFSKCLNYLGYSLVDVITMVYSYYLYNLIAETDKEHSKGFAYLITALCSFEVLFYTVGVYTGKLFTMNEGKYVTGPWHEYSGVMATFCFILMVILYVIKFRAFRINSAIFVVLIVFVPALSTVLVKIDPNIRFGFIGATLSMHVVYVIVQSRIVSDATATAELYNKLSYSDALTGLANRRGYGEFVDGFSSDKTVAVVFADVNSLKRVNDSLGHQAGDKLIQRAANLLKKFMIGGTVYRISGDEFVCIFENPNLDEFEENMKKFADKILSSGRILSFGYKISQGEKLQAVINAAEQKMYVDKQRYYEETGKERRK
jgi:diguanylate cyclase (GGDEF)-like protein